MTAVDNSKEENTPDLDNAMISHPGYTTVREMVIVTQHSLAHRMLILLSPTFSLLYTRI